MLRSIRSTTSCCRPFFVFLFSRGPKKDGGLSPVGSFRFKGLSWCGLPGGRCVFFLNLWAYKVKNPNFSPVEVAVFLLFWGGRMLNYGNVGND